jgi:integrase
MTEKPARGTEMPMTLPEATWLAAETRAAAEGRDLSGILAAALNLYLRTSPGEDPAPANYGKGRLFLRGTTYWTAVWAPSPEGKWHEARETTRTDDERKARRILEDRIRKVKNHRDGIETFQSAIVEKTTVNDILDALIADYELRKVKSIRHSISHLKPIRAFFGTRRALSVSPDLVRNYIEMRKAKGRSSAKVNRETELLNTAYVFAVREGRLQRRPYIRSLPEPNARRGFFEKDEYERIVAELSPPVDDIARFAYICGWRREEIRTLRWENVDRENREVRLYDSKNGEGRALALDDEAWKLFAKLWVKRRYTRRDGTEAESQVVFHRNGKPVTGSVFWRAWKDARERANIPDKLFHDFRRTAARNMIRAGVAQTVAMSITGHKTDSMFRRYNVSSNGDQRDAMRRQREYLASGSLQPDSAPIQPTTSRGQDSANAITERPKQ